MEKCVIDVDFICSRIREEKCPADMVHAYDMELKILTDALDRFLDSIKIQLRKAKDEAIAGYQGVCDHTDDFYMGVSAIYFSTPTNEFICKRCHKSFQHDELEIFVKK
jgi:hypothetical protein